MRVLVWLVAETWETAIAAVPETARDVTLLYVVAPDVEEVVGGARAGLLGRGHGPAPPPERSVASISEEAALELLEDARRRLGRAAELELRRGRIEREVVAAAADADLLVLARDGDRSRLGPHSIGRQARFVIDHAPCQVLLVWPDPPPSVATIPPAPD